jgi:hypothetical protein
MGDRIHDRFTMDSRVRSHYSSGRHFGGVAGAVTSTMPLLSGVGAAATRIPRFLCEWRSGSVDSLLGSQRSLFV